MKNIKVILLLVNCLLLARCAVLYEDVHQEVDEDVELDQQISNYCHEEALTRETSYKHCMSAWSEQ